MPPLRQHYALNIDDRLLNYDEAVRVLRAYGEPERYYCPGCSREIHISLQTGSFIHNTSRHCQYETYIHNLAVKILFDRFNDETKDFMIGTKRRVLCREYKSCPFYTGSYECWDDDIVQYDLKKIYDQCDYPSGGLSFTADLIIYDGKRKLPPVYIVIRTDYLAPLDLPPDILLIEIAVSDEERAEMLGSEAILEGGDRVHCLYYGPWKRQGGVSSRRLCERR